MRRVVRAHYRKSKNKVTVVRKHYRTVQHFKNTNKIASPISVEFIPNSKGTSLGHTDTVLDGNKPVEHRIRLEKGKIKKEGEDLNTVLHHELGHVLDKEKKVSKKLLPALKRTAALKRLRRHGDNYEKKPDEIFARAYAQHKTKKVKKTDVQKGLALSRKEYKSIHSQFKKSIK